MRERSFFLFSRVVAIALLAYMVWNGFPFWRGLGIIALYYFMNLMLYMFGKSLGVIRGW